MRRPALGWVVVAGMVAFNVFTHEAVQGLAGWLGVQLTIDRLTACVTWAGIGLGLTLLVLLARTLPGHAAGALLGGYLAATAILIVAAYNLLFMINTEAIHFPQYALLGMIVFLLVGRFAESITWVMLFGAVDEAWQYWVLNAGVDFAYFDFNDIVLNLLGGALGVLLVATLTPLAARQHANAYGWDEFARSLPFRITAVAVGSAVLLRGVGLLSVYPAPDALIVLMQSGPRVAYWETSYWGKTAHVLLPFEGTAVVLMLLILYLPLDKRVGLSHHSVRAEEGLS